MSNTQPAGGRVLRKLSTSLSGSSRQLFANAHLLQQDEPVSEIAQEIPRIVEEPIQESIQEPASEAVPAIVDTPEALSDSTKLALFDEVLNEVENSHAQPQGGGPRKEALEGGSLIAPMASSELPAGVQYSEQEHSAEIPPEVESYIQEVQELAQTQPQEMVIAETAPISDSSSAPTPPRIIRVLPITKEQAAVGMRKNQNFSIRWLVEYGNKLAKMFIGQVVYKQ
ncbi:hypothetical protein KA082_02940 [Candidatus Woesebacteria bacterium]|nr:hypothetical protein [Candidatus Woesebacteria bacterium]